MSFPIGDINSRCYSISFLLSRRLHFQLLRCVRRTLFVFKLWRPASPVLCRCVNHPTYLHCAGFSSFISQISQLSRIVSTAMLAIRLSMTLQRLFICARYLLQWICKLILIAIAACVRALNFVLSSSSTHLSNDAYTTTMLNEPRAATHSRLSHTILPTSSSSLAHHHQLSPQSLSSNMPTTHAVAYKKIVGLKCALANVRSMVNKVHIIANFIVEKDIQIMFITESWLQDNDADNQILHNACPPSFKYLSVPRPSKKGGGLAILFKDSLQLTLLRSVCVSLSTFEHVLFTVSSFSKNILFCLIYRPPSTSVSRFLTEISDLCALLVSYDELVLLGDFNISRLLNEHNNGINNDLTDLMETFSLTQHVQVPTHQHGGILDLIFTRQHSSIVNAIVAEDGFSDHMTILFDFIIHVPNHSNRVLSSITFRPYKCIDVTAFQSDISAAFQNMISQSACPMSCEALISSYKSIVTDALDVHAPYKVIHIKSRRTLPWFNSDLRALKRSVRKAERKWRNTKLEVHRSMFVAIKTSYNSTINEAASDFLAKSVEEARGQPKRMWSVLNSVLGRVSSIVLPDHSDLMTLAESFNASFLHKPASLRAAIDTSLLTQSRVPTDQSHSPYLSRQLTQFHFVTSYELNNIIHSSPSKSSSLDPLPTWLLRRCIRSFIPFLTTIVNSAIADGMPNAYKLSYVTPLLKKKNTDKNNLSNYRPVSNLSFVSKLIERTVVNQIVTHMNEGGYWDPQQHAYRQYHSCETALLDVLDTIYTGIDEKKVTLLVLLDLSAAFDTIDHGILSQRLQICGIIEKAHKWIVDYLNDRQQMVQCKDVLSSPQPVSFGVPQGSVLGPVLFNIYLTGLRDLLASYDIHHVSYADDLQLMLTTTISGLSAAIEKMENCINGVKDWFASSFLSLNDFKTEFMILGSPPMLRKVPNVVLKVGDVTIKTKQLSS
jgi:hypothetical protein